jgi:chaperonin GroEL
MPAARHKNGHVVFQPATYHRMQKGIAQIVAPIRFTLGPCPRCVGVDTGFKDKSPELLDDGGLITRRIIALPDRDADMGAMLVRHLLWRLHETTGDGTATAAVIFQAVYDAGVRYITAGGNAMQVRRHLERGARIIADELAAMARPVAGKSQLAQIAESICHDPPLARLLGEIFDIIGQYGQLDIRIGAGREPTREYVEGGYWPGGVLSREMVAGRTDQRLEMENAAILITDLEIDDPRQLAPAIEAAISKGHRALLIVARKITDSVTAFLLANSRPEKFSAAAVKAPGLSDDRSAALEDIAVLAGGRPLLKATGDTLEGIAPADLGAARRAWADTEHFGLSAGRGDSRVLRQHISRLRGQHTHAPSAEVRTSLGERLGRLMGGSATLRVGGPTLTEANTGKALAERTASALRHAIQTGVIPGGGASLLACRDAIRRDFSVNTTSDERAARNILLAALETPARVIIANAGYEPGEILARIEHSGAGSGFDAVSGQIVDMAAAGIYDVAGAYSAAVHGAITTAALALTVDVLVHSKKPEEVLDPR